MNRHLMRAAPALFVCLWATGFIGGKLGLPYAGPLTFLLLRFLCVLAILVPAALVLKPAWPVTRREVAHVAAAGLLVHAGYLGGVFAAIHAGLPAGLTSLIVGLQPVLTAIFGSLWLKERVTPRQWLGLALGLVGVALVVAGKGGMTVRAQGWQPYALAVMALFSITFGTLYQKRHGQQVSLLSGTVIQYGACAVLYAMLAPLLESMRVTWSGEFLFALGWLVLVLSIASITLLYLLIREGAATRVTSLFYMVPPTTAVMAWLIFGEDLSGLALTGLAVCAAGVALVVAQRKA